MIKDNAAKHLISLRAEADMDELERRTKAYRERFGQNPAGWSDLVRAGLPARRAHGPEWCAV